MRARARHHLHRWLVFWDQFWFAPQDRFGLALFRIVVGGGGFFFCLFRQWDYELLFSEHGILPYAVSQQVRPQGFFSPIAWEWLASAPHVGYWLHLFLLVLLAGLALGCLGRVGAFLAFILNLAFIYRNLLSAYGADQVLSVWLLYLSLTRCNDCLAFRWPRAGKISGFIDDMGTSVGTRLIQIQLCVIYGYCGIEKARGASWWQGDALWDCLANAQMVSWNFGFLSVFSGLLAVVTFMIVIWEIYFPLLVWIKPMRAAVLTVGVILHLGIGLVMHLPFFALFMIAPYFLFIDGNALRKFYQEICRTLCRIFHTTGF